MMTIVPSDRLAKALEAEGLLPPGCGLLEVVLKPGKPLTIRYEVVLTEADYMRFARAFKLAIDRPESDA